MVEKNIKIYLILFLLVACGGAIKLTQGEESWCRTWWSDEGFDLNRYANFNKTEKFIFLTTTFENAAVTVGVDEDKYTRVDESTILFDSQPNAGWLKPPSDCGDPCYITEVRTVFTFDWFLNNLNNNNSKAPDLCKAWYDSVQGKSFIDE